VSQQAFWDAALVLLGHGTAQSAESAVPVYAHAAELRRRGWGQVREAFWKQEPRVHEVLATLTAARVFIVPLFMSQGYFSDVVIPRQLGFSESEVGQGSGARVWREGGRTRYYCEPIGTHEKMAGIVLSRAREVLERFPFPRQAELSQTTLFIAGHGTRQNANSRQAIERQVEQVRAQRVYADVRAVFLEEEPSIGECYRLARTRNLVVVPFFLSAGPHVVEDIPRLLGEPEQVLKQRLARGQRSWRNPTERNDRRVWYAEAVGSAPEVAAVIVERVREAVEGKASSGSNALALS
jgi:sirohydrochlorin cobaltochelatase